MQRIFHMKVSIILSMYAELPTSYAKTVRLTHVSEFSRRMLGVSFCCCANVNFVKAESPATVEINFAGRNQHPKDTAPPGGQCAPSSHQMTNEKHVEATRRTRQHIDAGKGNRV